MLSLPGINILTPAEAGFTPLSSVWVIWAWPARELVVHRLFETRQAAIDHLLAMRPAVTCTVCLVQHELDAILDPDGREALR